MSTIPDPCQLVASWRDQAEAFRRYGADPQATALEACADDLAQLLRERELFEIGEEEAERISGYSRSALYKMRERGDLPNVGSGGSPRYRLRDLPRKPGKPGKTTSDRRLIGSTDDVGDRAVRSRALTRQTP